MKRRIAQLQKARLGEVAGETLLEDQALLEHIENIEHIDHIIGRFYDLGKEDELTRSVGALSSQFGIDEFKLIRMNASGNNSDCLIHSFFTSYSKNFRRLTPAFKNEFANFFRRSVFLTLPVVQIYLRETEDAALVGRISGDGFLEEIEITLLAAQFRVNMLTATKESYTVELRNAGFIAALLPPACVTWRVENFKDTICIYTSGNHFESVRDNAGYTFTAAKITNIRDANAGAGVADGENANLNAAMAASLVSAHSTLSRKNMLAELGLSEDETHNVTNAGLRSIFSGQGGGRRKTRRHKIRRRRT